MSKFKVGDVVVLKSGSLPMTVYFVNEKAVTAIYYIDGNMEHTTPIPEDCLSLKEEKEKQNIFNINIKSIISENVKESLLEIMSDIKSC